MEKSAIQNRYDQLNQEILDSAKKGNVDLSNKKVTFQKNLSQILGKRKQEEAIFDEEKKAFLFEDDPLYAKAKESGNQELLEKFHNRSLTRKEYVKTCKDLDIDLGCDYFYNNPDRFDEVGDFNKYGLAKVRIGKKQGLINKDLEEITELKYDFIGDFDEYGLAKVHIGKKCGLINKDLEEITAIDEYDFIGNFDKYGLAKVGIGKKQGLINKDGEKITAIEYDCIGEFDKYGLVNVRIGKKWGLINEKGKIVAAIEYDAIGEFSKDGVTKVRIGNEVGLINKKGEIVVEIKYDDNIGKFDEYGIAEVKLQGKTRYINMKGEEFKTHPFKKNKRQFRK